VWTKDEILGALDEEAATIFNRVYGVEADGNSPAGSDPHGELVGKNTLIRRLTTEEAAKLFEKSEAEIESSLAESRLKLLELRAKRPRPHLDDKIITAWNGLMISAFARGANALGESKYLEAAQRSARFLRDQLWKDGALLRSYRQGASEVGGFCDDYAFLIAGLLDLYEADFDTGLAGLGSRASSEAGRSLWRFCGRWLLQCARGRSAHPSADERGLRRRRAVTKLDRGANLLKLAQITDRPDFRQRAEKTLAAFADQMTKAPSAVPQMLCGLDASLAKPRQVVIAGSRDAADTRALLREVHGRFEPNRLLLLADGAAGQKWLGRAVGVLAVSRTARWQSGRIPLREFRLPATSDRSGAIAGVAQVVGWPHRPRVGR
jgi:uncharacterized protein YyaL (SSP411 family)